MKATVLLTVSAVSILSASAALPVATKVDYRRGMRGKAIVTYTLDRPAVVTFDVQTNGVSIGRANLQSVSGDLYKLMPAGEGRIVWESRTDWSGHRVDDGSLAFVVYAWDVTDKPDYMVVDLSADATDRVRYYPTEAEIPGGLLENPIYRTTSLVMKRVHAADWTWLMGGELEAASATSVKEKNHLVTLDHDYYMGVFEVTQKQWSLVYGDTKAPAFSGDARPMETVRYDWIRNADYPDPPADSTFLALLNTRTGVAFDLPSEAEWEFAARAGVAFGCYNTGVTFRDPLYAISGQAGELETAVVGSFAPNRWGFYDFHGNVSEICLDWFKEDITDLNGAVCTDSTSEQKAYRGGSYKDAATFDKQRVSVRNQIKPTTAVPQVGFRLCARNGLN